MDKSTLYHRCKKIEFRFIATIFCLFALSSVVVPGTSEDLQDYFEKAAALGFSGAVLAARGDKVVFREGFGWADSEKHIPIMPNTIFDVGSGTKAFTATAILQLEERGKLNTSDLLSKYFPDIPADKRRISIHHLLTHTAGLSFDYFYDQATPEERKIIQDRDIYVQNVLKFPLAFEPGKGRLYSNTGFSLLAAIVEKVSGESYEDYVQRNLFQPAGMRETGYYVPKDLARVAKGYNDGNIDYGYPWETQWDHGKPSWDLLGNGGMLTTLDDMYKWLLSIKNEAVVSKQTKEKLLQVYYPNSDQGLGWNVSASEQHPFLYRVGDAVPQAWNVEFRWYWKDDFFAIVLSNRRIRAGSFRRYAAPQLVNIALFNKRPDLPKFQNLPQKSLSRLVGKYRLNSGESFEIEQQEVHTGEKTVRRVLSVRADGQKAVNTLLGIGNEEAAILSGFTEKSADYIRALSTGNLKSILEYTPDPKLAEQEMSQWKAFCLENGDLIKSEMVGTSPLNIQGYQTYIRMTFRKSSGTYVLSWRNNKLNEQDENRLQPAITRFLHMALVTSPLISNFLPESATMFSTYDLFKNRRSTFEVNEKGMLVFQTIAGPIVATKSSK